MGVVTHSSSEHMRNMVSVSLDEVGEHVRACVRVCVCMCVSVSNRLFRAECEMKPALSFDSSYVSVG